MICPTNIDVGDLIKDYSEKQLQPFYDEIKKVARKYNLKIMNGSPYGRTFISRNGSVEDVKNIN